MKRLILMLAVLFFAVGGLMAQSDRPQQRGDRSAQHAQIASQKVAFITEKLALTPTESEKFWPMYNQYWESNMSLARAKRQLSRKIEKETATKSDLDALIKLQKEEVELMERYAKLFETALPVDKVAKFFVEQENFKSVLMRRAMQK